MVCTYNICVFKYNQEVVYIIMCTYECDARDSIVILILFICGHVSLLLKGIYTPYKKLLCMYDVCVPIVHSVDV